MVDGQMTRQSVFSMTCWSAAEPTNPEAPVRKRVLLMGRGLLSHGDGLLINLGHLGCGHDGNVFDLAGTDYCPVALVRGEGEGLGGRQGHEPLGRASCGGRRG